MNVDVNEHETDRSMLPDMTHGRTIYVIIKKYGMQIDKICHLYTYTYTIYNCNFTSTITF